MDPARTLVASYCFPPYSDTAGIVAAKRIREAGEPVDVVANAMDSIRHRDPSLTQIGGDLVRRFTAVPSLSAFSTWAAIPAYVDLGYRSIMRWQHEQGAYAKLYSRAQFAASHFLAARYKIAHPDVEWTAEFSDPLSHDVLGKVRTMEMSTGLLTDILQRAVTAAGYAMPEALNGNEWCEVSAFALADTVVFTNELQRDFMLDRCHDPSLAERVRERAVVSPHPTLPREFYSMVRSDYALDSDRINIAYFGNFYVNRGVGLVLDALAGLPKELADRICVHMFTSKPGEITIAARNLHIEDAVRSNPYVEYLEFLSLTDRMDLLLVNDAVTPKGGTVNPFLPSKWSDYKGSVTPVWAIVEEGSSLDHQSGLAYRTPTEHLTAIQQVLAQVARDGVRQTPAAAGGAKR